MEGYIPQPIAGVLDIRKSLGGGVGGKGGMDNWNTDFKMLLLLTSSWYS